MVFGGLEANEKLLTQFVSIIKKMTVHYFIFIFFYFYWVAWNHTHCVRKLQNVYSSHIFLMQMTDEHLKKY